MTGAVVRTPNVEIGWSPKTAPEDSWVAILPMHANTNRTEQGSRCPQKRARFCKKRGTARAVPQKVGAKAGWYTMTTTVQKQPDVQCPSSRGQHKGAYSSWGQVKMLSCDDANQKTPQQA